MDGIGRQCNAARRADVLFANGQESVLSRCHTRRDFASLGCCDVVRMNGKIRGLRRSPLGTRLVGMFVVLYEETMCCALVVDEY